MPYEIMEWRKEHLARLENAVDASLSERRHATLATATIRHGNPLPHTFEAWLDIPDLSTVLWFSGGARQHSQDIVRNLRNLEASFKPEALVAGQLATTQAVSGPVVGASFEASVKPVPDSDLRDAIFLRWTKEGLFTEKEIEKYISPENPNIPPHDVYLGKISTWRLMDTNTEPRLVVFGDQVCGQKQADEPQFGMHNFNPHLHVPFLPESLSI